jgi:hypothetical protein
MKAERRHELQTNVLADFLSHGLERHRQYLPIVVWGGVAVLAVILAFSLWNSRHGSSQAQAWEAFDQVRYADGKVRPKRLKELAEQYPNTEIALWARLDLADQLCFDGREKIPVDREIASTYLKEAQQNYALVLQNPNARPEMIRRAALAEPKCWELIGDRDKAIASYKMVAEKYERTLPDVSADAARHASDLAQPEAADFYKWLAEYKPPTAPTLNFPGFSPNFPPFGDDREKSVAPPAGNSKSSSNEETSSETIKPSDPSADPAAATEGSKKDDQPEEPAKPE